MVMAALIPYLALSAAVGPVTPIITRDLHTTPQARSIGAGLANAAYAVGTVLAVQFAQLLPQRRMLLGYAFVLVLGSVITAAAQNVVMYSAGQILAVTFTSRAAGEMRARLRSIEAADPDAPRVGSVQALTFHAAARRQLSYFWPRVVGNTSWQLLDSKFAVVAQAANRARLQASTDDVRASPSATTAASRHRVSSPSEITRFMRS